MKHKHYIARTIFAVVMTPIVFFVACNPDTYEDVKEPPTTTTVSIVPDPGGVETTSTTTTTMVVDTSLPPTTVMVWYLERAIDGDTIEIHDGSKVRLVGIDTPERGECGYNEATDFLAGFIDGHPMQLTSGARTDADRYGRLLRYVSVDGEDAGMALLTEGLAIARYDSRDGYGRHPLQDQYIAADNAAPNFC